MTVHFIGAGPGAPDLLTIRGRDLIAACPVCLYAGSLIPEAVLAHCPPGARLVNTASLDLDAITAEIAAAHGRGQDVARLQSGDLSVWSAMGEQLRRLQAMGIPYTVTPGVPSFAAAAAALEALTRPCRVALHTDSEYVRNGVTRWHAGWVRRNWRNAAGEPAAVGCRSGSVWACRRLHPLRRWPVGDRRALWPGRDRHHGAQAK